MDDPEIELEAATGSLFECINAAMEVGCFAPASNGRRSKATATSEDMLEESDSSGSEEGEMRRNDEPHPSGSDQDKRGEPGGQDEQANGL